MLPPRRGNNKQEASRYFLGIALDRNLNIANSVISASATTPGIGSLGGGLPRN